MKDKQDHWNPSLYTTKHSFVYDYGKALIDLLDPKSNERILDLGCGSGQLTALINQSAKEVIGIDQSAEMINNSKANYPDITFMIGDATSFQFEEKFDSIFSNATLHWVKDYKAAIKSMHNNLEEGGKIVLEFGGKGNVQSIVNQLKDTLHANGFINQSKINPWYFPSIGEYSSALEAADFRVIFAHLFDRPTELADMQNGIKDWLTMFATQFFHNMNAEQIENIINEVQAKLATKCLKKGKWYADYKRIRIVATKG